MSSINASLPSLDDALVTSAIVPFGDAHAVLSRSTFAVPPERMYAAMVRFDRFAEWVPLIESGEVRPTGAGRWRCRLKGRLGIWKLGIPIDMRFELKEVGPYELVIDEYHGGTFPRLHFHHRLIDTHAGGGTLESLYYFDLDGFTLVQRMPVFRKHPWLRDEIQMVGASMMVRGLVNMAGALD